MLIITRTTKVKMEPRNYCGCCIMNQVSKCPELSGLPECKNRKCKIKLPLPKEKVCLPILCQNCWPCQHNQPGQPCVSCVPCWFGSQRVISKKVAYYYKFATKIYHERCEAILFLISASGTCMLAHMEPGPI